MANEPTVTINGHLLSTGQSMTLRVALTSFVAEMVNEGLGDDEHGKRMTEAYAARGLEVQAFMFEKENKEGLW